MSSRRPSPGFPVLDNKTGRTDTDERYESSLVSSTDSADERARACEKAYRARRVSFGRTISVGSCGSEAGSSGGGLSPRIIKSP